MSDAAVNETLDQVHNVEKDSSSVFNTLLVGVRRRVEPQPDKSIWRGSIRESTGHRQNSGYYVSPLSLPSKSARGEKLDITNDGRQSSPNKLSISRVSRKTVIMSKITVAGVRSLVPL